MKHDCWFNEGRCIFCERPQRDGEKAALSMCRVHVGDGSGYVCAVVCGNCKPPRDRRTPPPAKETP